MKHDIAFFEDTHEYIVDGVTIPSVTEILQPLTNRGYANVSPSVLEYARNRGTAVHGALEMYDLTGECEIVPEIHGYVDAYLEWSSIYRPTWIGIEQIVYNHDMGYIGTLDRIGTLNGTEFAVVDLKTSSPTKEALVAVCTQTAAYAMAYAAQKDKVDMLDSIHRYGLFLKPDGTFRFLNCEEYEDKYGFDGALLFLNLYATNKAITSVLNTKARKK